MVYLDESTMPKDSKGSTGSSYIVDRKNRKVLIPIDVNKIEDIKKVLGTLTEEVAHGKDALEGRQDKKVAEDKSNDEEGLESLGRPANDYVKNKLGEDNNSKIKLSTDGIDLSNVDVGEKVGDVAIALPVAVGAVVVAGLILPEENKEAIKKVTMQVYEDIKEKLSEFGNNVKISYAVAKTLIEKKLREKGIIAEVKIDKNGNLAYIVSSLPEDMKKQRIPPILLPEEENPRIPPMEAPKQETQKERWEREERFRREQKEKDNERSKPNGIPLQQERPVTIYKIQYKEGDLVELPLDENGKIKDGFIEVRSRDGKGKAYVNEKDNGYWEKDRRAGTSFAHGGSYWKRYPSRRDAEKSEKNRITITSGAEIENDEDTSKKGKGKVLRK